MDRYEIRVAGHLDLRRARSLGCEDLRLLPDSGSLLVFFASDQAALYGLLARLRNAGIELVAADRAIAPAMVPGGARSATVSKEVPDVDR
jgi:hypothetical protein